MNDNIGLFQKRSKKQLLRTWSFLLPLKKQNLEIPGVTEKISGISIPGGDQEKS